MPPLSSVLRNCFYSVFEVWTDLAGATPPPPGGDGKSVYADIVCHSSCKTEEKI